MDAVRLVTFDIFGTLLDWQSYVDQAFPGRYVPFLAASASRQEPGQAVLPYRRLLYDVAMDLSPRASREVLSFFADGMGFAKPFTDSRAVQYLATMAMTGALSNCDYRHMLDVQKTLGHVFDVTVLAEELGAYKPHAEAWDQIYETVTRRLGFDRASWLHVSAFAESDLIPAKERGIATCFLPRPGGSNAAEVEQVQPDYAVSDLWQLAALVAKLGGTPVRHTLKAVCSGAEIAQDLTTWLRYEHGPELLQVRGCQSFQVLQQGSAEVLCEFVFTSRKTLADFLNGPAAAMEKRSRERFPAEQVRYERDDAELLARVGQRNRLDFPPPRRLERP